MEQAHTRLIAQLNERIAAADNTPLYLKFAETVKRGAQRGAGAREYSARRTRSQPVNRRVPHHRAQSDAGAGSRGRCNACPGLRNANPQHLRIFAERGARFSQQVVLRGKTPNTLWVNKRVVKCPEEVASQLSLEPESEVFMLKRIRYVDDDAVSIEESRVPVGLIPDPDAIGISLYDYFRSQNIFPQRTRSRVSARMPDSEFQAHIKMDEKYRCW